MAMRQPPVEQLTSQADQNAFVDGIFSSPVMEARSVGLVKTTRSTVLDRSRNSLTADA